MEKRIIAIGREFGSGGREVGTMLAKALDIPFYDKELLKRVAQEGDFHEKFLETHEETAPTIAIASFDRNLMDNFYQPSFSDSIFVEQSNVIRDIAAEGPCVIVGRCADYILRDEPILRVFMYADMPYKISRKHAVAPEKADYTDEEMEKYIRKVEKARRKYYEHYTGQKWGLADNYDLCINTSKIGSEGALKVILDYLENYK